MVLFAEELGETLADSAAFAADQLSAAQAAGNEKGWGSGQGATGARVRKERPTVMEMQDALEQLLETWRTNNRIRA